MTAKQSALTLTNAALSKRQSYRQTPQNIVMQQVAQLWQTMDATAQGDWQDLADSLVTPTVQGVRTPASAYGHFFAINSTLVSAGAPPITAAPASPIAPAPLPPVQLIINYNNIGPVLTLAPNSAYPHSLILMGAKPLYAGQNVYTKGAFKKIGFLPALSIATNISEFYLAKFRLPKSGYQIALKLIGVSASGTRTPPLFVTAVALNSAGDPLPPLIIE